MPLFYMFPQFERVLNSVSKLVFGSDRHPDVVALSSSDEEDDDVDEQQQQQTKRYSSCEEVVAAAAAAAAAVVVDEDKDEYGDALENATVETASDSQKGSGHDDQPPGRTERRSLYAVTFLSPTKSSTSGDSSAPPPLVTFDHLRDAIDYCKKHKADAPRWKLVADTNQAQVFSNIVLESADTLSEPNGSNGKESKGSAGWRMPASQETVKLRKSIETGTVDEVRSIIESNPRFLIGNGDTPTVLQEGCRYNACHIAAKADRADMLALVLATLRSKAFFKTMYPDDADETTEHRMAFLIDLYLNIPDKTRKGETPLHFACKFGSVECVRLLLEQPECDRSVRNGEGLAAQDIICERVKGQPTTVRKIKALFDDQFVIPILRDEEGDSLPQIGTPVTSRQLDTALLGKIGSCSSGVPSARPARRVSALVGPVSAATASDIMADLATLRLRPRELQIRRTDAEKGLESIAREVARRHGVPWTERWDFLDRSIDLATAGGLEAFETYLRRQYAEPVDVAFITGPRPSKTDYHVWTALESVAAGIDREQLPFIGRWIGNVDAFSDDAMKSWKTPMKISFEASDKHRRALSDDMDCLVNLMSRFGSGDC